MIFRQVFHIYPPKSLCGKLKSRKTALKSAFLTAIKQTATHAWVYRKASEAPPRENAPKVVYPPKIKNLETI